MGFLIGTEKQKIERRTLSVHHYHRTVPAFSGLDNEAIVTNAQSLAYFKGDLDRHGREDGGHASSSLSSGCNRASYGRQRPIEL